MAEDPVAAFLAREKAELGDITSEIRNSSDVESDSEIVQPRAPIQTESVDQQYTEEVHDFASFAPNETGDVFGQNGYTKDEKLEPNAVFSTGEMFPPTNSVSSPLPIPDSDHGSSRTVSPALNSEKVIKTIPESSVLLDSWKANFDRDIQSRDQKEEQKKLELETNAKKELDTWYAHYRENRATKSANNRSEAPKDASGKAYGGYSGPKPSVDDTALWDSVCGMCDLQGKHTKSDHDLSRMRGLLLNLKSNPTTA